MRYTPSCEEIRLFHDHIVICLDQIHIAIVIQILVLIIAVDQKYFVIGAVAKYKLHSQICSGILPIHFFEVQDTGFEVVMRIGVTNGSGDIAKDIVSGKSSTDDIWYRVSQAVCPQFIIYKLHSAKVFFLYKLIAVVGSIDVCILNLEHFPVVYI
ncbi:hypothetical protein DSECCO2_551220 [anaerobic digester metagenome]